MSTLKRNITAHRIALLAQKGETLFHTKDLATLWKIKDPNTLRTTLKRYTQNGLLYRVYRGFYSLMPLSELDPLLLGSKALHQFCYLSTQSILYLSGHLSQPPSAYTFVSEKSQQFKIGPHHYKSRQLAPQFLYNPEELYWENGVQKATPERAIADLLYFNPKAHFDKEPNWRKIKKIQQKLNYSLTPNRYDSTSTQ